MVVDQLLPRCFPGCVTRVVDWFPIFRVSELCWIALEPAQARALPCRDVQRQLPDRMCAGNRMRRGFLRRDSFQQREHRWSMPRFTFECTSKLIANAFHFGDGSLFLRLHRLIPPLRDRLPILTVGNDNKQMKQVAIFCDGSSLGNGKDASRAAGVALLGYKGIWRAV